MRLNTYILALTLAASVQVLAEEVTLGVWHKLNDHESFEKRGEIRFDADEWFNLKQSREQVSASSTKSSKQKLQQQQQQQQQLLQQLQSSIVYQNIKLQASSAAALVEDFVLNVQGPIVIPEREEEPQGRDVDEDGEYVESEEEFEQRLEEWKMTQEELDEQDQMEKTPGSYVFYQIKLRDESRGWEAMSSIKSCLLVASDFQEQITLHLDQDRQVFAFDYYTSASKCENEDKKEFPLTSLDLFKSVKVDLSTGNAGPKARYSRAQAIKIDNQTGKPEEEKTFFQKYWVYILPIVLVMLFTGGGEPEKTAA
ncbi:hypothetical protein EDD21DRAFT_371186 [Dissophora ornata]|nr:hypothetical protein EDD21DRAFT_371186 [Dissophora ornata]